MASSFRYGRFLFAERLVGQKSSVRRRARQYQSLFECPYEEIRPRHRSFAFTSPTIRIVDIRNCNIATAR